MTFVARNLGFPAHLTFLVAFVCNRFRSFFLFFVLPSYLCVCVTVARHSSVTHLLSHLPGTTSEDAGGTN